MQAALLAWNPIYVDQENGTRVGSFYLVDNEINFDTQVGSDPPVSRRIVDDVNLIPNLIALVTENTGRGPSAGETWIYDPGIDSIVWGAGGGTTYAPSMDFSDLRNSMYAGVVI
jgi:hypothetical protein